MGPPHSGNVGVGCKSAPFPAPLGANVEAQIAGIAPLHSEKIRHLHVYWRLEELSGTQLPVARIGRDLRLTDAIIGTDEAS